MHALHRADPFRFGEIGYVIGLRECEKLPPPPGAAAPKGHCWSDVPDFKGKSLIL